MVHVAPSLETEPGARAETAAHTPGPWHVAADFDGETGGYSIIGDGAGLADVYAWVFEGAAQSRVNACLIAAAPEMLWALQLAAAKFEFYRHSHEAKGTQDGNEKAKVNAEMVDLCRAAIAKATQP